MRRALLAAALGLSAAVAHARPPGPAQSPEQAVAAVRDAWASALASQSLEEAIPLYTADAVFLAPDAGRVAGRESISGLVVKVFASFRAHITLTSRSVHCSGALCVDEGSYEEQLTAKADNSAHSVAGNYLNVLRRDPDGTWRIADQVWTATSMR